LKGRKKNFLVTIKSRDTCTLKWKNSHKISNPKGSDVFAKRKASEHDKLEPNEISSLFDDLQSSNDREETSHSMKFVEQIIKSPSLRSMGTENWKSLLEIAEKSSVKIETRQINEIKNLAIFKILTSHLFRSKDFNGDVDTMELITSFFILKHNNVVWNHTLENNKKYKVKSNCLNDKLINLCKEEDSQKNFDDKVSTISSLNHVKFISKERLISIVGQPKEVNNNKNNNNKDVVGKNADKSSHQN
jgi:hypothetical protein